jgi:hypothetical protein
MAFQNQRLTTSIGRRSYRYNMGDIITPPNVPANTPPNFGGQSLTHATEWWDGWLTGTSVAPGPYKVINTLQEPCPQETGINAPPPRMKITEIRQNTSITTLTYTVTRYILETNFWWYIGAGAVALGVVVAVVATAGWGAGLIVAATAKGAIAAGATLVTLGSGVVSISGRYQRGSYIGTTTTTETVGPTDVGAPYPAVVQACH